MAGRIAKNMTPGGAGASRLDTARATILVIVVAVALIPPLVTVGLHVSAPGGSVTDYDAKIIGYSSLVVAGTVLAMAGISEVRYRREQKARSRFAKEIERSAWYRELQADLANSRQSVAPPRPTQQKIQHPPASVQE